MMRVTVEILPQGDASKAKHLGTCVVVNDGHGDEFVGNYDVHLSKWGDPLVAWKKGHVKGFPRKGRGPWDLLFRALQVTVGQRNRSVRYR